MHSHIGDHDESPRENGKTNDIFPQSKVVESKCTQDRCARHLDVEAVFVIDESKEGDFVDNETFETVVEDRELWQISKESSLCSSIECLLSAATVPP